MKNLIRGHIYLLKKDNFFFGCLALSLIFLIVSIRLFSLGSESNGIDSLMGTFLNGDIPLYAFMLLTSNMIAEAYRSGAIKNIVGRGISKKQYYLSSYNRFTVKGTAASRVFYRLVAQAVRMREQAA